MIKYIVMLGGLAVKYATKKSAETAAKNMGGKLLSKPTQKVLDTAVSPKSLKNNPTMMEKVKSQIGIAPKQTRTMPRPGKIDQKKGIAVGKLSQTAYKRQKQLKAAGIVAGVGTLAYAAGKDAKKDDKIADKDTKGKAQAETKTIKKSNPPETPKSRPKVEDTKKQLMMKEKYSGKDSEVKFNSKGGMMKKYSKGGMTKKGKK
jgi:hypothetical protein